jgi:hypothetical protein
MTETNDRLLNSQEQLLGIHTKLVSLYREIQADPEANHELAAAMRILQEKNATQPEARTREAVKQLVQQEILRRSVTHRKPLIK